MVDILFLPLIGKISDRSLSECRKIPWQWFLGSLVLLLLAGWWSISLALILFNLNAEILLRIGFEAIAREYIPLKSVQWLLFPNYQLQSLFK